MDFKNIQQEGPSKTACKMQKQIVITLVKKENERVNRINIFSLKQ
jgi:hypothetical protein